MKRLKKTASRIQKGIKFLSAHRCDVSIITDLTKFDMSTTDFDILGIFYGDFFQGLEKLGIDRKMAKHFGFEKTKKVSYKELTNEWVKAIDALRQKG